MKPISDALTCGDSCTYLRGRLHVLAGTVARTCRDGCTYLQGQMLNEGFSRKRLRERLQCFASERGKTGAEIVSPVLDKRKGGSIRHSRQPKKREKGKGKKDE